MTRLDSGNKYHAQRTWSENCQRWFASAAEAHRGLELKLLEMAGEIYFLEYQKRFVLSESPKVTITIDFSYIDNMSDKRVYEDYKGVLTRDFRTKLAWLKQRYGIEVKLIRG